jgi:DNA-binding NarL/FixJ family response regulator
MTTSDGSDMSHSSSPGFEDDPGPSRQAGKGVGIVLIDRRPVTRQCLSRWLQEGSLGLRVIPVSSPAEFLKASRSLSATQMIVFSIGAASIKAPEVLGKITLLRRHMSNIPLVLLCDRDDVDEIVAAVELGARGYIPTSLEVSEAAAAIQFVAAGGTFVPASAMMKIAHDRQNGSEHQRGEAGLLQHLTPRETEVLAGLRHGKRNKVIAHELAISENTVKVFVRRILRKMQASNRAEVASLMHARPEPALTAPRGAPNDTVERDADRTPLFREPVSSPPSS